ncbi:MAG TPA: galactitol-1-phosphate 5-dehydrogenase [Vicinamibacterales bacterium]
MLVRVRACGVCGSDIHGYDGSTGRRIPPLVMGHEAAGVIEAVGARVTDLRLGDRVTFDSTVSCGACDFCRRGQINLCDRRTVLGVSCGDYRRHGAFAEFVAVPARITYRLPDALPFEHAALVEAVSVAVHAVGLRVPGPSDTVVVIGCGMIGLLVVQALRAKGCTSIIGVDIDDKRSALAMKVGATAALDGRSDVPREIARITHGRQADHAFEVVGFRETVLTAIRSVRKGGTVTLVGNLTPMVDLPLQEIVSRQLTLLGSCASSGEYPACIDLMTRRVIDVGPLISATAPLDEGPAWFERLYTGHGELLKVILRP